MKNNFVLRIGILLTSILILSSSVIIAQELSQKVNYKPRIYSHQSIDSSLTFRGIFAVDEQTAYVSGNRGSFFKTRNGGETWERITISNAEEADFRDIHVLSNGSLLLLSVGVGSNSKIYKSIDDGETWSVVYTNPYAEGFLNSFAFWNDSNGIAVGDPIDEHPFVIITNDGGETWQEIDETNIPKSLPGEAGFAASGTCVAVYGEANAWIGMGGPKARIFKTSDMSKTWTVYSTPILSGRNTTGIYSVFFDNATHGFVLGGDYTNETGTERTIAYTNNGGTNWNSAEPDSIYFQSCMSKIITDKNQIFISTGPAASYFSSNGKVWNKFSDTGFHCLSADKNNKFIWAAGSNGRVAKIY